MPTIARTVYAAHLQLRGDPSKTRPAARARARHWLALTAGGWPRDADPAGCTWSPRPHETIECRTLTAGDETFWEATCTRPHDDATLRWVTTVIVGGDNVGGWAHVRVGLEPAEGHGNVTGWVGYDAHRPALVRHLVDQLEVVDADRRLASTPWRIETVAEIDQLAALIASPQRRLPVIVGSRFDGGEAPAAPLGDLADSCAALVHVADITETALTFELTNRVGRQFSVHSGAMRVFFAGWEVGDPPRRHQLVTPSKMSGDAWGGFEHRWSKRLYAVAAFRTPVPALVERVTTGAHRARIADLQSAAGNSGLSDDALDAWEHDLAALDAANRRVETLRAEAARLARERDMLASDLAAVTEAASRPADVPAGEGDGVRSFASVADAVRQAARDLRNLQFHPQAFASADRCSYRWPNRIYDDLAALDAIAGDWRATGRLAGGWAGAAAAAGLPWANDVSRTARGQYRGDYEITVEGTKVMLGPHLRRGAATGPAGHYRAYMHIDNDRRAVTVGYIGAHLRDASNN